MASDFGRMADRVADFKDELKDQHKRATRESMGELAREVVLNILQNDSVARRVLVQDVRNDKRPSEKLVERAVNVPEWAKYLEHGTGHLARRDTQPNHKSYKAPDPGPPAEKIETWVNAKTVTSSKYDDTERLAEAIANTIAEVGTLPRPFLRPAWYSGSNGYRNVVQANKRGMQRALRRL